MIEAYRNSVRIWECDDMGHMNIQFYVDKATGALEVLSRRLGLPASDPGQAGPRLVVREHHIRFLREQLPGAPIVIHAGVLDTDGDQMRIYFEMRNPATEQVAATLVARTELADPERGVQPLPPELRERAEALRTELPEHGAPRGLELDPPRKPLTLREADEWGLLATYLTPLEPQLVDSQGYMFTRGYIGVISDSIPNFLSHMGNWDRSGSRIGGAALEYRVVYRQRARQGCVLALRTGLRHVGPKAYTFCHWLFDNDTGQAVASAEAVAVMFDLEARRAIAIPEERRGPLERLVVPGLSA
ncbi:MAG: acyl-ACP thioesterase [Ectothiorhodospiraceae bacterium]|nr:acyl-ACP thioesterase [Ectothiorhodospiraceae bacterium]